MNTSALGKLILIPVPIAEGGIHTLAPEVVAHTETLRHYFVENLRTARRTLRAIHRELTIDDIQFAEIDKHAGPDLRMLEAWLREGKDVGVMSEAGCPGVADPGADLVAVAHRLGATVLPLTGPSSILLALMASGLNGQRFAFQGYLPQKAPERGQRIAALETLSRREGQTQIFIETPYRNTAMLEDLLKHCNADTWLCVAQNIGSLDAFIQTRKVSAWRSNVPLVQKVPAVFCLLAG
jgi:16S rRNA (cytidine1402-2'-O)-methyltransferase